MMDATVPFASARDRHLFGPGPKRLLAVDGGGVRQVKAEHLLAAARVS